MSFDFKEQLLAGLERLELNLPEETLPLLELYFLELKKWNKRVNLIAKSSTDLQIVENHILDSLTLLPYLRPRNHLLDIGTGGGFPGLVCKVALPAVRVSLVEPRQKRVNFLRHLVRTLGLDGVEIYNDRIENKASLAKDPTISHITGRAVTEIGPFLQMVEAFSFTGAEIVMMKGRKWREELLAAEEIVRESKFDLFRVEECALPFSGAKRCLLFFSVIKD